MSGFCWSPAQPSWCEGQFISSHSSSLSRGHTARQTAAGNSHLRPVWSSHFTSRACLWIVEGGAAPLGRTHADTGRTRCSTAVCSYFFVLQRGWSNLYFPSKFWVSRHHLLLGLWESECWNMTWKILDRLNLVLKAVSWSSFMISRNDVFCCRSVKLN